MKLPELLILTGLSRTNVYEQMKAETFPLAVKLGERSVGWYECEVIEWLRTRPRTKE